jgi:Tol biopolymer transport system component
LGGEERLLMRGPLRRPRFSPDGQWVTAETPTSLGKVFIIPASGGAARPLTGSFYSAHSAIWSPDAKNLLIAANLRMDSPLDWWVVPVDGSVPVKTGAVAVLEKTQPAGISPWGLLEWLDDYVLYSDGNLWRIRLSAATRKVTGGPERLTVGPDNEEFARAIPANSGKPGQWRIVFASTRDTETLWSLPIDLNAPKRLGDARKLISDAVPRNSPSLSADGTKLVYVSRGLDSYSIRTRDMRTGTDKALLNLPQQPRAKISPDGNTVAYNPAGLDDSETVIFLVSAPGEDARKLCDTCGLIYNWTRDGKQILFRSGSPIKFSAVDVASGEQHVLLAHPKYNIHGVVHSPDSRWLAVQFAPAPQSPRAIYIVPVRDGKAASESEWIAVLDRPGIHRRPWWSPDGNTMYLVSTAGGREEIWAQRLQPATKRPLGEPFRVYGPPGERYSIYSGPEFGPAIGPRELIFPMSESFGNIWLAE